MEFNNTNHTWNTAPSPAQTDETQDRSLLQRCPQIKYKSTIATVVCLGLVICLALVAYFVLADEGTPEPTADISTLKLTSILFRHGARTPTWFYNSDPYKHFKWPEGLGGLTNEGKVQAHKLGVNTRLRYGSFIPVEYRVDDIYVLSSDLPRTLMSASTFLAGLYPPNKKQLWNPNINWQPIPVHTMPRLSDNIIGGKKKCKLFDKHYKDLQDSDFMKNIFEKNKDLYDYLSIHCNQTINTTLAVEFLYSTIKAEIGYGLSVPEWVHSVYPEKLIELTATNFKVYTYDDVMKRIKGGPLLSDIIKNMEKKHLNSTAFERKLSIYSGHDLTIVNLMNTLGFSDLLIPDYSSAFIIELHKQPNATDSEIRMFYMKGPESLAEQLTMPLCNDPCSLTEFINITSKYIPVNWDEECESNT